MASQARASTISSAYPSVDTPSNIRIGFYQPRYVLDPDVSQTKLVVCSGGKWEATRVVLFWITPAGGSGYDFVNDTNFPATPSIPTVFLPAQFPTAQRRGFSYKFDIGACTTTSFQKRQKIRSSNVFDCRQWLGLDRNISVSSGFTAALQTTTPDESSRQRMRATKRGKPGRKGTKRKNAEKAVHDPGVGPRGWVGCCVALRCDGCQMDAG